MGRFKPGDRVRIVYAPSTAKHLVGAYGRVTKIGGINVPSTDVTVKLDSGAHGLFTEDQLVKAVDE
jgi:hypothetical protein